MDNINLDNITIEKIQKGNKTAFQDLFSQYYSALCSFAYQYMRDAAVVEDIVQEVFVAYWESKSQFSELNPVKAFLYTSTRNKCLNELKHKMVVQKHEPILIKEIESEAYFSEQVILEESFNLLHAEIKNLPESARNILLLSLKGLKNKDIADKLNISENTVKTQKKIAYAKLRDKLGHKVALIFWVF